MASSRLEAMRKEVGESQAVFRKVLPILQNYVHLRDAADELQMMDDLMKELSKDREAVAAAIHEVVTPAGVRAIELPEAQSKNQPK